MKTIVSVHPWDGSFNKAIMNTIIAKWEKENTPYQIIDLHKDNFNPIFTEEELSVYHKGEHLDPLITKYQEILKETDTIIFLFPIWWATLPAILKGFFDKVMLYNFAFSYSSDNNLVPLLNIKKSYLITTSAGDTEMFRTPIESFIQMTLMRVGINDTEWLNCQNVVYGGEEHRKEFLKQILERV